MNKKDSLLQLLALRLFRSELDRGRDGETGAFASAYDGFLRRAGISLKEALAWADSKIDDRSFLDEGKAYLALLDQAPFEIDAKGRYLFDHEWRASEAKREGAAVADLCIGR